MVTVIIPHDTAQITKYILSGFNIDPIPYEYRSIIIKTIASMCMGRRSQINIKGKTTEKLGVIGKKKAIACEVITSIKKYEN